MQLVLGALLWTAAAGILGFRAFTWLVEAPAAFVVVGVAVGLLKARFLLDGAASRAVSRIQARGRDACAGGFLSLWSWALVLLMISAGHALRLTSLPRPWLGLLYAAVATALLFASRKYWRAASAPAV
ncbi:MAG: hypothetical protein OEV43_03755 [Coriobacteriia bacterium]|nr:hypothetical protein [Coriobacteriia bacterium]